VEAIDYPEIGMEAVLKIEVGNLPAFIVIGTKATTSSKKTTGSC
jgi:tartrate dehydratase beta subunit/fumarate hydratase class I family protein